MSVVMLVWILFDDVSIAATSAAVITTFAETSPAFNRMSAVVALPSVTRMSSLRSVAKLGALVVIEYLPAGTCKDRSNHCRRC